MQHYGKPEIFNTDQGSQFTGTEFTQLLKDSGIAISMDGRGCWRDNVFVERLWKSIKYEEVYLHAYETVSAARSGIGRYLDFYNSHRPHSALDGSHAGCILLPAPICIETGGVGNGPGYPPRRTLLPYTWGGERLRG